MLVTDLPVRSFLRYPFGTLSDGGFVGFVFLIARTADAPGLHQSFLRDWSDIHDLTDRHLAVITPSPSGILIHERAYRTQYGTVVPGVTCVSEEATERLGSLVRRQGRSAVRMTAREADVVAEAPTRPGSLEDHQVALTTAVSALQKFFGISESLLPCAVVVSLYERQAVAVALDGNSSVYHLLKLIKTELEPMVVRINQGDEELTAAKDARSRHRIESDLGLLHDKADSIRRVWAEQVRSLSRDLDEAGAANTGELAELCRWMSQRLGLDEPLTDDERTSARALLKLLGAPGTYGRLPKRLRRTLAKLNSGYPAGHVVLQRQAAAEAGLEAAQDRVGRAKAGLDALGRELRLSAAVTAGASQLGLTPVGTQGLLSWRELGWPITVLARPTQSEPTLRFGRA